MSALSENDSEFAEARVDWLLWQLADSSLPTGGFSHSGGLEAVWQHRLVRNSGDLRSYLETALTQLSHSSLPFVGAAFHDRMDLESSDLLCDAFLSNHVANRASRAQGRAFLAIAGRALEIPFLTELRNQFLREARPTHLAPVFGAVTFQLGLTLPKSAHLYVFTQLRGWISSAVRLGILGPLEAQQLQYSLAPLAQMATTSGLAISPWEATQTAPFLDLVQGTQDRLYSRLFQS